MGLQYPLVKEYSFNILKSYEGSYYKGIPYLRYIGVSGFSAWFHQVSPEKTCQTYTGTMLLAWVLKGLRFKVSRGLGFRGSGFRL